MFIFRILYKSFSWKIKNFDFGLT